MQILNIYVAVVVVIVAVGHSRWVYPSNLSIGLIFSPALLLPLFLPWLIEYDNGRQRERERELSETKFAAMLWQHSQLIHGSQQWPTNGSSDNRPFRTLFHSSSIIPSRIDHYRLVSSFLCRHHHCTLSRNLSTKHTNKLCSLPISYLDLPLLKSSKLVLHPSGPSVIHTYIYIDFFWDYPQFNLLRSRDTIKCRRIFQFPISFRRVSSISRSC